MGSDHQTETKSRALSKSQRCFAAFAAYHQYHSHCCEHAPEAPWCFFLNHQLTHFCWGVNLFGEVYMIIYVCCWFGGTHLPICSMGLVYLPTFTCSFLFNFMPCMSRWAHLGFIFGLHVRGKRVGPKNEHGRPSE